MPAWRAACRWCRATPTPIWWNIPAQVFDAVILSQTIQATEKPRVVLEHLLRIGRRVAISLPNFGYWKVRLSLLAGGRMPRTRTLDYTWWDTPNIHLCTLADFVDLTRECGATIVEAHALDEQRQHRARCEPDSLTPWLSGPQPVRPGRDVPAEEKLVEILLRASAPTLAPHRQPAAARRHKATSPLPPDARRRRRETARDPTFSQPAPEPADAS